MANRSGLRYRLDEERPLFMVIATGLSGWITGHGYQKQAYYGERHLKIVIIFTN